MNGFVHILEDAAMELRDIYDEDRNPTGRTIVRGEPCPENGYHLVVHMCVFNRQGEMLL